jgi:hypothetical protein
MELQWVWVIFGRGREGGPLFIFQLKPDMIIPA